MFDFVVVCRKLTGDEGFRVVAKHCVHHGLFSFITFRRVLNHNIALPIRSFRAASNAVRSNCLFRVEISIEVCLTARVWEYLSSRVYKSRPRARLWVASELVIRVVVFHGFVVTAWDAFGEGLEVASGTFRSIHSRPHLFSWAHGSPICESLDWSLAHQLKLLVFRVGLYGPFLDELGLWVDTHIRYTLTFSRRFSTLFKQFLSETFNLLFRDTFLEHLWWLFQMLFLNWSFDAL